MRRARPARRVLIEAVPRRDAAQRLSLAFCLLVREGCGPAHLAASGPGRGNLAGPGPDPGAPVAGEEARP
jgi:hypothetical protein